MADDLGSVFICKEDGAALVEAALILPVLLLLVFSLTDLSLYFWQRSLVSKAADLGARAAIVLDSVAEGSGLTPSESASYWFGRSPGASCWPGKDGSACPAFRVACTLARGCICPGGDCPFRFSRNNLTPILRAMQVVLPRLKADNIRVTYATNNLGYVGRPPPVPVDIRIDIINLTFEPSFAGLVFAAALPLTASATLPGEDLVTNR